ncbi:hypothetical protein LguiB_001036 [Lonicera macranthoides]
MVNDSRSGCKAKDDERNNSKKKLFTGKGSSTSGSGTNGTSELRRSTRETPSRKQTTSSPSIVPITRKSVRLEKRAPSTPPVKTKSEGVEKPKSEGVEKQIMTTPLRRSDRGKKQTSSSSSGSEKSEKGSGSSNLKQIKGKTGKIVRRLTAEAMDVSRSNRHDTKPVGRKRKRMNARTFKALLKRKVRKDNTADDGEVEGSDKSSQVETDSGGDSGSEQVDSRNDGSDESSQQIGEESRDESREESAARSSEGGLERPNSNFRNFANETLGNNSDSSDKRKCKPYKPSDPNGIEASKSSGIAKEALDYAKRIVVDCSKEEKLRTPQVVDSASVGKSTGGGIALRSADKGIQYKRKRDHDSQKEDPCSHNNKPTLNKELCDSPIPKVYDSMKYSRSKYSSGKTWSHREVQVLDDSPEKPEAKNDGGKQHKIVVAHSDAGTPKLGVEEGEVAGFKPGSSRIHRHNGTLSPTANSLIPEVHRLDPEERGTPSIEKTSFNLLLKRKISKLSEVLKLSADLKAMALRFLEYVIENHHVNKEPGTILQAFLISLCWIAGSLLKQKIDRKESVALAKKHLNFTCKEEEADSVYSKLRLLKRKFLSLTESTKDSVFTKDLKEPLDVRVSQSPIHKPANDKTTNGIKSPLRKCDERMPTLLQKQQDEIQEFHRIWAEKRVALEKDRTLESAFVHSIYSHAPVRRDKLNVLDEEFAKKMEEHKRQKEICLKDLQEKQLSARNDERLKETHLLAEAKSPASVDRADNGSEKANYVSIDLTGEKSDDETPHKIIVSDPTFSNTAVGCSEPTGTPNLMVDPHSQVDEVETMVSDKVSAAVGCRVPSGTPNLMLGPHSQTDELETMVSEKVSAAVGHRVPSEPSCLVDSHSQPDEVEAMVSEKKQMCEGGILSKTQVEEIRSEAPEAVTSEVVEGFGSAETITLTAVESNRENGRTDAIGSDTSNPITNKNDGLDSFINRSSPSAELSLPRDGGQNDQPNHEPEPLHHNQPDLPLPSGLADEPCTEGQTPLQNAVASPQLAEEPVVHSDQAVLQTRENLEPNSRTDATVIPLGHNEPDSVDHQPICESGSSPHNDEGLPQLVVDPPAEPPVLAVSQSGANLEPRPSIDSTEIRLEENEPSIRSTSGVHLNAERVHQMFDENHTSLQNGTNLTTSQGFNNFPLFIEHQLTSRMMTLPLYADPLQNELESIRRVKEQAVKVHEDTKARIKFECDKELEETIARIRKKYEVKLQEAESAFLVKKIDLETNYNRVFMNRLLAHAFRTKCVGPGTSGALGTEKVAPSSSVQQQQSPVPLAPRPSPVTATSSASHPGASQQAMPPQPPPLPPPPSPQIVQQSAALLSSMPTRPPNINSITPSAGNHRGGGGGEFRAPAPHLQRFRPPASMSVASLMTLQREMQSHQAPSSLPSTSLVPSQPPPRPPPSPSPSPPPPPPPPSAPTPPQPSALPPPLFRTNHSRHSSTGGPPPINNSVPSALQLLMDIDKISSANRPNILPPLNVSSFNLPETGTAVNLQVSSSLPPVPTDIVCLSDED